jgi:invasion protein IalB
VTPDTPRRTGTSSPNLSRYRLDPGLYALQIGARTDADFVLRIRSSDGALAPEPNGSVVRVVGDWTVGERVRPNGARVCFARTVSNNQTPSDWRLLRPVLEFQVEARFQGRGLQGANRDRLEVGQRFDALSHYAQNARFEGLVALPNGRTLPFPLSANRETGGVESLRRCDVGGGDCLVDETIFFLTQGTAMRITSRTNDGRPSVVDYSLIGYQGAMTTMAALCGDRRIVARMIRR